MTMFALRPHQEANITNLVKALSKYGGALDMSDGGTGKSLAALGLCKKVNARPIIITRKAIMSGWEGDCKKIGVEPFLLTNYEQFVRGNHELCPRVVTKRKRDGTPYHWGYEWRKGLGRVVFIFDESQGASRNESETGKILLAATRQYKTLLLSATPFATPLQAGPTMAALRLCQPANWYFEQRKYGVIEDTFGGARFIGDIPDTKSMIPGTNAAAGREIMERIHNLIIPERGVRTRRSQIPGFPETSISTLTVDLPPVTDLNAAYLEAVAEARMMDLERVKAQLSPELHEVAEVLPCVQDLRDRMESEVRKLPVFEELIDLSLEKGNSVAVFLNFNHSIDALAHRYKCKCIVRGTQRQDAKRGLVFEGGLDRHNAILQFRANKEKLIILNSAAGGAGVSLHDDVTQVQRDCYISPPWSAQVAKQVLYRPHRLGGGFSEQKFVFARNKIEGRVRDRVENRMSNIDALTDGDLRNDQ